jgi:hypothetical protein
MKNLKALSLLLLLNILSSTVFAAAYPFPVPYIGSQHTSIYFKDLAGAGSIQIYTIAGEKVADLSVAPGEVLKQWDVRNNAGQRLASGVYIYLITAGGETTKGKLVVIL